MKATKERLEEIKEQIDSYRNYSDKTAKKYLVLLKEANEIIIQLESPDNSNKLNKCIKKAKTDIKIELRDRFDPYFFTMREKKKQDELGYSRLIVSDAIKQINKCLK